MSRLAWDRVGERFFETGIDRGVLYPNKDDVTPVAWNGLVALNETTSGGEAKPFYLDGYKFQNRSAPQEYEASLEAFTYPHAFEECQGMKPLGNGLYLANQPKITFGLCYRTRLGNDLQGPSYASKLHFVYNASVAPTGKNYGTVNDNPEPATFSWPITTKAVKIATHKATSHMVVDTSLISPPLLTELEDLIYGTSTTDPSLPTPTDLIALIVGWPTLSITDLGNGIFIASGPDDVVRLATPKTFEINSTTAVDNGDGSYDVTSY